MQLIVKGGGFAGFWYNYGALCALSNEELERFDNIYTMSSGTLAIAIRLSGKSLIDIIQITDSIKRELEEEEDKSRKLGEIVEEFLVKVLPDDIHENINKLCNVQMMTTTVWGTEYLHRWSSKEDVIECVKMSCYIPYVSGDTCMYKGKYMDGCIGGNLSTMTMRCFGKAKWINYKIRSLGEVFYPIDKSTAIELFDLGFESI